MELNAVLEHLKSTPNEEFQKQWNSIRRENRSGISVSDFFRIQRVGELKSLTTSTNSIKFKDYEQWMSMNLDELNHPNEKSTLDNKKVSETKPFFILAQN